MELKVGDACKCPDNHRAKIVWISEDKKLIGIKCHQNHLNKVVNVAYHGRSSISNRRFPAKEKEIYAKDMVFLVRT